MYLIPCMLCHVLLCTSTLALDAHHRREREVHFCLLADLRTLLWLPSFSFLCTLASLSSTSFWRIFLSLLDAPRCCKFFTFLREEPLWMWPSSRIVQNSFQRIKQKVKEFKEATDKTLVWANTMTAMLSKKLWSAMFNVYSSFAYTRWNLPPRLVSENQKGRLKNNPEAIIEVCTLLYPVSKMIIIEIQISIQRSSRWATNWYEVCPTAFSSPQQALTIPLHPGNYQEQVHLHPGTLSIEPPALPLIGFTVMDFLNPILIRNTNTKYYIHTITDAKYQIVCKTCCQQIQGDQKQWICY